MTTVRTLFALLLLTLGITAAAQSRNAAYAEIGGSGIIPTANYEHFFSPNVAGHIGLGAVTVESDFGDNGWAVSIPIVASYITHAESNHHLEAGGGVLFIAGDTDDISTIDDEHIAEFGITGLLGYRYQKPERGFLFRASYTPIFSDGELTNFGGVSFGYAW